MKKKFKKIAYIFYLITVVIILFEISYRYQIIDFYKPELKEYNSKNYNKNNNSILVFGDSFSANNQSYVKTLQDSLPNISFINNAVSGTGIIEANLIAKKRVKKAPKALIYQIYVGNDLMDIRKKSNASNYPFWKKVYYSISNNLISFRFLNYRLSQFKTIRDFRSKLDIPNPNYIKNDTIFSIDKYSDYEKQTLNGDQKLLKNSILVEGDRIKDFNKMLKKIETLLEICKVGDSIPVYLVVVPHCSQINSHYKNKYEKMGLSISQDSKYTISNYPFIKGLKKKFSNKNIKIINLLPALRSNDRENNRQYLVNDFHFSERGIQTTASEILKYIKK